MLLLLEDHSRENTIPLVFTISQRESLHTTFAYDRSAKTWRLTIDDIPDGKSDSFGRSEFAIEISEVVVLLACRTPIYSSSGAFPPRISFWGPFFRSESRRLIIVQSMIKADKVPIAEIMSVDMECTTMCSPNRGSKTNETLSPKKAAGSWNIRNIAAQTATVIIITLNLRISGLPLNQQRHGLEIRPTGLANVADTEPV